MFCAPDRIDQNSLRPVLTLRAQLTRCILHLALRAFSLRSNVQLGNPAELSCVQIASQLVEPTVSHQPSSTPIKNRP